MKTREQMMFKKGETAQAKIKSRWRNVLIKRVSKNTIGVEYKDEYIKLKSTLVRPLPVTKEVYKRPSTKDPVVIDKESKTVGAKVGTKKNPWISLNDLRSHNLLSTLSYEDKVKFEHIILTLIKEEKWKTKTN